MMNDGIKLKWNNLVEKLNNRFDEDLDFQGILFLIGIQELGKGHLKLNKNQKLDVIHIAVCALLSQWDYYEFEGHDEEGWPHWKSTEKLPNLSPKDQDKLIKEAVIEYFS
ncbi:hypothetical protein N9E30_02625 [Flavobacteriales bacterium]|jgi:hypothetical protein|nr:hypothetical protein [Flavobacteriales bacterium]|tara:strand:+ start:401 stop:730 length:330 start_codon:yes stop_codon:yes gene_type:complete